MNFRTISKWIFRFTIVNLGIIVIVFVAAGAPIKWIIVFSQSKHQEEFIQKHASKESRRWRDSLAPVVTGARLTSFVSTEEKPNLRAETLTLESASTSQLFHVGEKLTVICGISGASASRSYKIALKTDKEEIILKTIGKAESNDNTMRVTGTYIPKESGLHPIACRVDFENEIEESDERDNRLVKYAMIF